MSGHIELASSGKMEEHYFVDLSLLYAQDRSRVDRKLQKARGRAPMRISVC